MSDENVTHLAQNFAGGKVFVFGSQNRQKKSLRRNGFSFQKRYISTGLFQLFQGRMSVHGIQRSANYTVAGSQAENAHEPRWDSPMLDFPMLENPT